MVPFPHLPGITRNCRRDTPKCGLGRGAPSGRKEPYYNTVKTKEVYSITYEEDLNGFDIFLRFVNRMSAHSLSMGTVTTSSSTAAHSSYN